MKKGLIGLVVFLLLAIGGLKIYYDNISDQPSDKQIISDVLKVYKGLPSNIRIEGIFVKKPAAVVSISYLDAKPIKTLNGLPRKKFFDEFDIFIPDELYYLKTDIGWVENDDKYTRSILNGK